jgi:hypothetical protein
VIIQRGFFVSGGRPHFSEKHFRNSLTAGRKCPRDKLQRQIAKQGENADRSLTTNLYLPRLLAHQIRITACLCFIISLFSASLRLRAKTEINYSDRSTSLKSRR